MTRITSAREALSHAIRNDVRGTVSERDAKKILDSALAEIARSRDPQATFEENQRFMAAAKELLGNDDDAKALLSSYEARGASAVTARLSTLSGGPVLPAAVRDDFLEMVRWGGIPGGDTGEILAVRGKESTGFNFDYQVGSTTGTAHASKYNGEWILSPEKVSREHLKDATDIMRKYFDEEWAQELRDNGVSDDEIREMRKGFVPTRVLFAGSEDPLGLRDSYPLVIAFDNPTGSDHGCWVGFNPATGEGEAGTFN